MRNGIALSHSTLAGWVGACGAALQPLVDALAAHLRGHSVLHADETPVAVLSPGLGRTHRLSVGVSQHANRGCTGSGVRLSDEPLGQTRQKFLQGYTGALMVDDYAGYKALFESGSVTELACLAHVRRKFFDLHAANKSLVTA
jgi:hypothetical protein